MNQYTLRKYIIGGIIIMVFIIYLVKLFMLQVVDSSYKLSASNNVLRYETQYPARGLIYDRNGNLLVSNEASYDLMVNPQLLTPFDTIGLATILDLKRENIIERLDKAKQYSKYKPSIFLKQLSSKKYAVLQEKMFKFPGFFVQPRTIRRYSNPVAAHVLGYVGEVGQATIKKHPYYKSGDYMGISGIEKSYEEVLRGKKGIKVYLVDVHNRVKGSYRDGRYDTTAIVGKNITISLDSKLQAYGEKLMQNKIGSIVAIEPATGEILALISSPGYDPRLLVGRIRTKNYKKLQQDSLKPLFNRALMAQYPPGSTFKIVNGLIGLQEKVIWTGSEFYCDLGYYARGIFVGCHNHDSPLNFRKAIQNSCNSYFIHTFRRILDNRKYDRIQQSFNQWREYVMSFGFGKKLHSDFTNELKGYVPDTTLYDRVYGHKGWSSLTVYSLAIGQGELGTTPLQMANMTAAIANRGFYYTPHVVKNIEGELDIDERYKEKHPTLIDSAIFEPVVDGMELAVNGGAGSTAWRGKIPGITVCGKTGTAENPHGKDHSIFVAFAPKENPGIAISTYVENAGYGSSYAVPIARLMIEKYLKDTITQPYLEKYILDANLLDRRETER